MPILTADSYFSRFAPASWLWAGWCVSAEPILYPASLYLNQLHSTSGLRFDPISITTMRIQMPFSHGNEDRKDNREDERGRQQQQFFAYPGEHHDGYQPVYLAPPPPAPPADWPMPKLRLEAKELGRTGSKLFFEHINPSEVLQDAVLKVLTTLYTKEACPRQ